MKIKTRSYRSWVIWTLILVGLDQASKAIVRTSLSPGDRLHLLDGVLNITFIPNTRGYSWFVPDLPGWIDPVFLLLRLLILALAYPVYAFYHQYHPTNRRSWYALIGLSAGILGNLVDDVISPFTTDFIQVFDSPSGNLADLCVYAGFGILIVEFVIYWRREKPQWKGFHYHWAAAIKQHRAFFQFIQQKWWKDP